MSDFIRKLKQTQFVSNFVFDSNKYNRKVIRKTQLNFPNFAFEKKLWKEGFSFVAGIDEVGRGCFAGPVVAGCCLFSQSILPTLSLLEGIRIDDSKKLTSAQRNAANVWIKNNALSWGIGEAGVELINKFGIVKAARHAFRLAIKNTNAKMLNLESKIDFLLVDAFYIPYVKGVSRKYQKAIIKGDSKSLSIAAGSIIAKVYRDSLMEKIGSGEKFQHYGWHKNKGYGTKEHREAILKYGISNYHRLQFVNTFLSKANH